MLAIGITLDSVRDPIPKDRERQSRTLTSSSGHHQHTHIHTQIQHKGTVLGDMFQLVVSQVFSKALDFVFSDYSCSTYVLASFINLAQAGEEESSSEKMPQDQAIGKPVVLFLSD